MSKRSKELFAGTEGELVSMTEELDELHHDVGMPAMRQGIANMIDNMKGQASTRSTSRRTFLMGAEGIVAGGVAPDRRWHSVAGDGWSLVQPAGATRVS